MKLKKHLQNLAFVTLLGSMVAMAGSCKEDNLSEEVGVGTITGMVTDVENGDPIEGVTVAVTEMDGTVTTGSDGKYTITNVTMERHAVIFSKTSWLTTSVTVTEAKFDANKQAVVNAEMQYAAASINGLVTDATNNNAPLAGVTVDIGPAGSATTGANGRYLIENLVVAAYTATFSKEGYPSVMANVTANDFVDNVAVLDMEMGLEKLLRDKTIIELRNADKWHYSEYRGGRNGHNYPHWDWSTAYMATLEFYGNWENQSEGLALRTRNDGDQQNNPADLDMFDSYMYGSKKITDDTKILSLEVRTHQGTEEAPVYFGVQVVDLSAAEPVAVKVGDTKTHYGESYVFFDFDLSDYIGKEVIVAVGVYRAATGDYWKQMPIRTLRFSSVKQTENWMTGTEVIEGAKLTEEMVRSTMVNTKKSFTGVSPTGGGNNGELGGVYQSWRPINHVAANWSFVPVAKDPEPFASEGFIIKTRGDASVNTTVPEAYFYSKFAIAGGNNKLTLKTRNFGSNYTFFKLTAITEAGVVTPIAPASNTATAAEAANNGCWKFKHDNGGAGNPNDYASFVYDLSQFNGSNVVLCLGVFKGESNGDESKVCIYSISLD
jgi:hypothetical protein